MLTLAEAAQRLNLNPGTLRVQIHNGKLKGRKIGKTWTVTERELQRYAVQSKRGENMGTDKIRRCKCGEPELIGQDGAQFGWFSGYFGNSKKWQTVCQRCGTIQRERKT